MTGNDRIKEDRKGAGAALIGIAVGTKEAQSSFDGRRLVEVLAPEVAMAANGALVGAVRTGFGKSLLKEIGPEVGSGRNKRGEFHKVILSEPSSPIPH